MSNNTTLCQSLASNPDSLLRVYRERITQEIEEDLLRDVRPRIAAAAKAAVDALEITINSQVDLLKRDLLIHLELKFNDTQRDPR